MPENSEHSQLPLADQKTQTEIKKLRLEARAIRAQMTPAARKLELLKIIGGASAVITAAVAVIGGLLSVGAWFLDQQRSRSQRSDERLDRALTLLADQSDSKRLAAITAMHSFLTAPDPVRSTQVLVALSNALSLEKSDPVRNAIVAEMSGVDPKATGEAAMNQGLQTLIAVSRGLMSEGDLWRKRPENLWRIESDSLVGGRIQAVADAIVSLLRKGARNRDMSGVYLGREDLSNLDLTEVKFDSAILAWSDLRNCRLIHASFDGADLERTRFIGADLRGANLGLSHDRNKAFIRWDYVDRSFDRSPPRQLQVDQPDFSCADLSGADFSGATLFGIVSKELPDLALIKFDISFYGANLSDTDLRTVQVFTVRSSTADHPVGHLPFAETSGGGSSQEGSPYSGWISQIDWNRPLMIKRMSFARRWRKWLTHSRGPTGRMQSCHQQYGDGSRNTHRETRPGFLNRVSPAPNE